MTAEVKRVLDQCKALGIILQPSPDGEYLDLRYSSPPPEELRQQLLAHKKEIISLLKVQPPKWHAQRIALAVQEEGVCIFWSDLHQEMIAFIADETHRAGVPCGIVAYTSDELSILFSRHQSRDMLRLVHEAKRHGGHVTEHPSGNVD